MAQSVCTLVLLLLMCIECSVVSFIASWKIRSSVCYQVKFQKFKNNKSDLEFKSVQPQLLSASSTNVEDL